MRLFRLAQYTTLAAFLLIIAGGLVTTTGSGLAIPDWPLAYGTLLPPWEGGIRFEYSHRIIAGVVTLLIMALAIATWRARTVPQGVQRLATAALVAVVIQAILGGITVLHELPPVVSIAHAVLGQLTFCLVACITLLLSPSWQQTTHQSVDHRLRSLGHLLMVAVFIQLILGAIRRHTGLGLEVHILMGLVVLLCASFMVCRIFLHHRGDTCVTRPALLLTVALPIQATIGFVVAFSHFTWSTRTAHHGIGALILATSIVLSLRVKRRYGALPRHT
jgi:heme a synthase